MTAVIEPFTFDDYPDALALWRRCEGDGVALGRSDGPDEIRTYLRRNPGASFVARSDGRCVGAVLAGHDGRRGFLYHLAVDPDHRHRGLGRRLVEAATAALAAAGIDRCTVFYFKDNRSGIAFWRRLGWTGRDDVGLMSKEI